MASLQARTHLRSAHPLLIINKLASLTAFVVLLGAGWLVISYVKAEMSARSQDGAADKKNALSVSAATQSAAPEARPLDSPIRLVYACGDDNTYYHTAGHLPVRKERSALSEEAALQRGLKPCPICISK